MILALSADDYEVVRRQQARPLSALGTVGAIIAALWLVTRDRQEALRREESRRSQHRSANRPAYPSNEGYTRLAQDVKPKAWRIIVSLAQRRG